MGRPGSDEDEETGKLLDVGGSLQEGVFNHRQRPRQDTLWLALYISCWVASAVAGVYACFARNTNFLEQIHPAHLLDPASCPLAVSPRRSLLSALPPPPGALQEAAFRYDIFFHAVSWWIVGSITGSIALGVSFVMLVRHHPRALVMTAVGVQIFVPLVLGVLCCLVFLVPLGVVLLLAGGLTAVLYRWMWPKVELVMRLMGVAGAGLAANTAIIGVALLLQAALCSSAVPLIAAGVVAFMNGHVGVNPERVTGGAEATMCVDEQGQDVWCCTWQVDPWAWAFMCWLPILWLWTASLIFEIKVFTISATIGQWYFAPAVDAAAYSPAARRPASATWRALSWAVGPSLGSLCLGSALLTAVGLMRQAMERTRRSSGKSKNIAFALLTMVLSVALDLVQYLTKFSTVRLAITGETFFTAATRATDLLRRNLMDAYSAWAFPSSVLHTCSAVVSLAWSLAVSGLAYSSWYGGADDSRLPHPMLSAALFGGIAFFASWVVLAFCVSILLNVVDATFLCFAMDRDRQVVTRPDVHAVMSVLPTVGEVVAPAVHNAGMAIGMPVDHPAHRGFMAPHSFGRLPDVQTHF